MRHSFLYFLFAFLFFVHCQQSFSLEEHRFTLPALKSCMISINFYPLSIGPSTASLVLVTPHVLNTPVITTVSAVGGPPLFIR
jgi:hypothetical protein